MAGAANSSNAVRERERRVVRVALIAPSDDRDLVSGFPGRFQATLCHDRDSLKGLLDSASVDLVLLDCRRAVPDPDVLEVVRRERMIDFLAVGRPEGRKSLPSWMRSRWCPWPVDRRSFYRLLVALARKSAWERAFRLKQREVRGLVREARIGRELARVLHELGNPLDAVRRYVRIAKTNSVDAKAVIDMLDKAELGLNRMANTLGDLHREARQVARDLRLVDLRDVLRESAIVSHLPVESLALRTRLEGGPFPVPDALTPVISNLLLNARRACGPRGQIEIVARERDGRLRIEIRDDGDGFGPLFKEELFRPFVSGQKESEGLGLGLFNARLSIEQLGGSLDADSPGPGLGAIFTIEIPISSTDDEDERARKVQER